MTQLTILLVMFAGMLTLLDWRKGLFTCVFVGVAQDPLRKLAPGQPSYYVLLVGAIFGMAWVRAAFLQVPLAPRAIHAWRRNLQAPATAFTAIAIAQAAHSYISLGTFVVPGIGLLVWFAPVPAIMLAYQFAARRGLPGIRQWMLVYVVVALAALTGVYLEYTGIDWRTLGELGEGQIIYDLGGVLKAHSGFFRASEIAAWHTAAIACFVFTLLIGKRMTVVRTLLAIAMIALLVTLGILTGRRKLLIEITIFLSTYAFLAAWLQRGMARLAMVVVIMGFAGYVAIVGFVAPDLVQESATKRMQIDDPQRLEGYAMRGQSVFADLPRRVNDVGWQPLASAFEEFGWLGAGLGTGSQGTNDIVAAHNINRWSSEGGLGKVAMELGVPGLIVILWLLRAAAKHLNEELTPIARISPKYARLSFGLIAFLVANIATFTVATQAYSDLFILLILGWCVGFLFAIPVLARRELRLPIGSAVPPGLASGWRRTQPNMLAGTRR